MKTFITLLAICSAASATFGPFASNEPAFRIPSPPRPSSFHLPSVPGPFGPIISAGADTLLRAGTDVLRGASGPGPIGPLLEAGANLLSGANSGQNPIAPILSAGANALLNSGNGGQNPIGPILSAGANALFNAGNDGRVGGNTGGPNPIGNIISAGANALFSGDDRDSNGPIASLLSAGANAILENAGRASGEAAGNLLATLLQNAARGGISGQTGNAQVTSNTPSNDVREHIVRVVHESAPQNHHQQEVHVVKLVSSPTYHAPSTYSSGYGISNDIGHQGYSTGYDGGHVKVIQVVDGGYHYNSPGWA